MPPRKRAAKAKAEDGPAKKKPARRAAAAASEATVMRDEERSRIQQHIIKVGAGDEAAAEALPKLARNEATRNYIIDRLASEMIGMIGLQFCDDILSSERAARALSRFPGSSAAVVEMLVKPLREDFHFHGTAPPSARGIAYYVGDGASFDIARCSAVVKAGCIAPLVTLLTGKFRADGKDTRYAALALRNLAQDPTTRATIFNAAGVIDSLVSTVKKGHYCGGAYAAKALARLADSERNAAVIIAAGAIESLSQKAYVSNVVPVDKEIEYYTEEVTKALASIIEAGGVPPLVSLMMSENVNARNAAVKAFSRLPGSDDAVAAALVAALTNGDDMKKNAAARAVADFAFDANGGDALPEIPRCSAIVKADGIAQLVALLTKCTRGCQGEAARALGALAHDSANRPKIVSEGAIKALVSLLDAANKDADETGGDEVTNEESAWPAVYAARALAKLAISAENKAPIIETGAIESLFTLAQSLSEGNYVDHRAAYVAQALVSLDVATYISKLQSENASLKRQLAGDDVVDLRDGDASPPAKKRNALRDAHDEQQATLLERVKQEKVDAVDDAEEAQDTLGYQVRFTDALQTKIDELHALASQVDPVAADAIKNRANQ